MLFSVERQTDRQRHRETERERERQRKRTFWVERERGGETLISTSVMVKKSV